MSRVAGLYRRGNVWQYRVRVPMDIRLILNREFIRRSLKTADYGEALRRVRTVSYDIAMMFDDVRRNGDGVSIKLAHKTVTQGPFSTTKSSPDSSANISNPFRNIEIDDLIANITNRVLVGMGHKAPNGPVVTLEELFKRYMDDPMKKRSNKSIIEYNAVYGVLSSVIGKNTPIVQIDRTVCRQTLEVLRYLPPHAQRRFPGKSWRKISEIAKKRGLETLSPSTINKYLLNLSALLNWAVKEDLLTRNPARGLQLEEDVKAKDKRLPFSDTQLLKIFSNPVFTKQAYKSWPSRFWIPIIALYSGMRLNEICQMNAEDILELDGVLCFHITDKAIHGPNDKNVKTAASERVVPVHKRILDQNFIEYHSTLPKAGKLFPDLPKIEGAYLSHAFSKYFPQFLTRCNAREERTSFHSFRHNFRDAMRNAGIQHDVALALGGWTGNRGVEASYGRGYSVSVLSNALNMICYSDLEGCNKTIFGIKESDASY